MAAILPRWIIAFVLVSLTYNPTPYNFVRWATAAWETQAPLISLSGVVLAIAYVIFLRATLRSIGVVGITLVLALAGTLVWVAIDFGVLSLENPGVLTWLANVVLSFLLGVGLAWSIVRRKLSGQVDGDDVDE